MRAPDGGDAAGRDGPDGLAARGCDVLVACVDDARAIVGAVMRHVGWRVCEEAEPAAVLAAARAARDRSRAAAPTEA